MADIAGIPVPGQAVFVHAYALPPLPYPYDALEPHISAEIMTLHHDKHHQAYISNLNALLTNYSSAVAQGRVADQIALQPGLRFHGGGHINHALFWPSLAPASSDDAKKPKKKAPQLTKALTAQYGDVEGFWAAFSKTLLGIQGSGWGWLVKLDGSDSLRIVTTKDQDPVVDAVPVLGIDMWEHAYYLQYRNGKQSYVDNVWQIINWTTAEARFTGTRDDALDVVQVTLSV
ncbi:hypothetical protein HMPREF1624_07725 [Sporothrix schenckii ATCC 58251]|uniref:Superoxide dismutase n=1 Tax=Sporothrix schenckii (strain ATCC 58251 / de Perez 2211183) TaxID=1391915 RepID=U7PL49_SPOS1|nr:hypothetical protein HMPREF1624_07725 [Sporothrix schenckii ATCC 58251]